MRNFFTKVYNVPQTRKMTYVKTSLVQDKKSLVSQLKALSQSNQNSLKFSIEQKVVWLIHM